MDDCCIKGTKNFEKFDKAIDKVKAVLEPNRLRVLCILSKKNICVCDLAKKMEISHNLLSFHLKTLFEAGILNKHRKGNQIFYFIKAD